MAKMLTAEEVKEVTNRTGCLILELPEAVAKDYCPRVHALCASHEALRGEQTAIEAGLSAFDGAWADYLQVKGALEQSQVEVERLRAALVEAKQHGFSDCDGDHPLPCEKALKVINAALRGEEVSECEPYYSPPQGDET